MKKILFTLVFTTLMLSLTAQNVDRDRRIMEQVMAAASGTYTYASASHDTLEVAIKNAVSLLASQIVTDVRVTGKDEIHSVIGNGEIDERHFFDRVAETFTNVRLKDYHILKVAEPDRRNSKYTAFVYIEKETIAQIYKELEEREIEIRQAKERKTAEDVKFYYKEGLEAVNDVRIGDALKCWYWAYALSMGTDATIGDQPASRFIESKIERLLSGIEVTSISCKPVKINEFQEKYSVILDIRYKDSASVLHKVTNLDYEYNDGYTTQRGPRVRDGVGTLELQNELDEVRFDCIYKYDENETPDDVYAIVKTKGTKKFASATKMVKISNNAKQKKDVVVSQNDVELPVTNNSAGKEKIKIAIPSENKQEELSQRMESIEKAIRSKNYGSVQSLFTDEGYDSFLKLVKYGNASIVGKPQYSFMDFGPRTLCRGITMQFSFRKNKEFIEKVTFRFNADDLVESLAFTLSDVAEGDILKKGDWNRDSRLTLMCFLEDYQTAYALGRDKYLESIFSEKALIIIGHKLEERVLADGVKVSERIHYDTVSKKQYIERLKGHFREKEFINLNFTETDFQRATNNQEMFGIRVRQEYFSSNYCDVGYLFLLVDLRGDLPIIHVRAWQNDKLPIDSLIGLPDFY
ncbi:MAG: hypothetical protein K6A94_13205 [Bacteroidales bacterium]|nr:hypothetical protein [Bacteroidales bacterium]